MNSPSQNEENQQYQQTRNEPHERSQRSSMTADELRVLRECNTESFWYRCMPFALVGLTSVQLLIRRGILSTHPRFGALPKNMGVCLMAYVLGKISYQGACREKILRLEGSPLAEAMRQGLKGPELARELRARREASTLEEHEISPASTCPVRLDQDYSGSSDIDADKNFQYKGLDENKKPSLDDSRLPQREATKKPFASYDDLRKANRESAESGVPLSGAALPSRSEPSTPHHTTPAGTYSQPPPAVRRNKYGDIIEE